MLPFRAFDIVGRILLGLAGWPVHLARMGGCGVPRTWIRAIARQACPPYGDAIEFRRKTSGP